MNYFDKHKKIYMIGIGGVSMSALARILQNMGHTVLGSDISQSKTLFELKERGIDTFVGHHPDKIIGCDLVIYTGAIPFYDPERMYAETNNIPCIERSVALGEICNMFLYTIAVSGTHGKTTTSSMLAHIFDYLSPTVHIGGISNNLNDNVKIGDSQYFITEACEYKKSFDTISSHCAIVTCIEPDHMDCYKNIDDLIHSFEIFVNHSKIAVLPKTCPLVVRNKSTRVYYFGYSPDCDIYAYNLVADRQNCYSFDVKFCDKYIGRATLKISGKYNVTNALIAIGVSLIYKLPISKILQKISTFTGVARRDEKIGSYHNIPVICDYAHHPTEIKNILENINTTYARPLVLFQPHTYSRTQTLMPYFVDTFNSCNMLAILPTYPAREKYCHSGDALTLFDNIKLSKKKKIYLSNATELQDFLESNYTKYDCILALGAGNIYDMIKSIVEN